MIKYAYNIVNDTSARFCELSCKCTGSCVTTRVFVVDCIGKTTSNVKSRKS